MRRTRLLPLALMVHVTLAGVVQAEDNAVLRWNGAALQATRTIRTGPLVAARALAILHTAMYDAWSAYDGSAAGTALTASLRRPVQERTLANKTTAVSMAAYRVLLDLFPTQQSYLDQLLSAQGIDAADASLDPTSAVGIGNLAAAAVLERRHHDGANQLGDMTPAGQPYADYTGYQPFNPVDTLIDPNRWQPLRQANGAPQVFLGPHWRLVTPFALTSPSQFRPSPPHAYPHGRYRQQAIEVLHLSARLTDTDKAIAWYWADGPGSETPPGHWCVLARDVSVRDGHTLDDDVRLYFALSNALLDVSIAVWDCKVAFDSVRPVSAIRFLFAGIPVHAWGGPGRGTVRIDGTEWQSYIATPPFAEHVSGHSTFSSASAEILRLFTGSDVFGGTATVAAGAVGVEAGVVPATPVLLTWPTFTSAAEQAGYSRRLGGIHFELADLAGRQLGRLIASQVWEHALAYFAGQLPSRTPSTDWPEPTRQ